MDDIKAIGIGLIILGVILSIWAILEPKNKPILIISALCSGVFSLFTFLYKPVALTPPAITTSYIIATSEITVSPIVVAPEPTAEPTGLEQATESAELSFKNVPLPEHIKPIAPENIDLKSITFIDSGDAGKSINWELGEGILHIYGTGEMYNWNIESPWYEKRYQITAVIIDDGITNIGNKSFDDCIVLEHIEIPPSVKEIGANSFMSCKSLKTLYIPETVIYIGASAFNGCIFLEDVYLSEGVCEIDSFAFRDCTNLSKIILPKSVVLIGNNAFTGCANLRELHVLSKVTTFWSNSFSKTSPDLIIYCYENSTAEAEAKLNETQYKLYIAP